MRNIPIVPVKTARKLLGNKAKDLNDEQILNIIESLDKLATSVVNQKKVPNSTMDY